MLRISNKGQTLWKGCGRITELIITEITSPLHCKTTEGCRNRLCAGDVFPQRTTQAVVRKRQKQRKARGNRKE